MLQYYGLNHFKNVNGFLNYFYQIYDARKAPVVANISAE